MSIKKRLTIIVAISLLTILGLYGYIVKMTLDIDGELTQIEKIEMFEENISQLGMITEYYLNDQEPRYENRLLQLIEELENNSVEIAQFRDFHIVNELIPSLRSAFELVFAMNNEPELFPDPELRQELLNRASTRIRSDVRQLMNISHSVATDHINNIKLLQVDQRLDFLFILIPAILTLCLVAYFMKRRIIISLGKLQKGAGAFASGKLDERIDVGEGDEFGELATQFNSMAEKLESLVKKEKTLNQKLEKQADELRSSNEELENFASVASHDMKEPLRMVRNFMELLKQNYSGQLDEKANRYIHFAVDGAQRMTVLIDDLLEFSRIGRNFTEIEERDVNEIVSEVIQYYETTIAAKEAVVSVGEMPSIQYVPMQLRMLFQNLIGNALKYHARDRVPEIEIKAEEKDSNWQFSVSDNGIGIKEEYNKEIFDLFKRLHSTEEYSGTGMGLAMCKKIVEQHGGRIWVDSEVGKGSTFHFTVSKRKSK